MQFPEGYTRVGYIQSLGTQYIDTGFKPNQNTRVVMDAQLTVSGSKGQFFFGARGASYKPAFAFMYSTDGPSFKYAYNDTTTKGKSTDFTARLYLDANKNVCSFNGESITITAGTFQSAINMYLFASNENGTTNWYATMRLYSCRIYDNGNLVRDFIPCKNSSGVAGLYDFANGVFYDNDGTGTFTEGPEIVETLKIVDAAELDTAIGATAEAIRSKTGKTEKIAWNSANGFASAVGSIAVSSRMQSKTVTPSTSAQTIEPDSGYDALSKVTVNAMPTATQATPSITVSSAGLITASATQPAGYVATGTKSATKQLATQAAKTVTPSASSQTAVAAGKYTTGAVTVAAIPSTFKKVATGTFSLTNNNFYDGYTVSGLGFKPSRIILYLSPDVVSSASDDYIEYDGFNGITAYAICDGSTTTALQMSWSQRWEWVDDVEELRPYVDPDITTYEVNVTFTNNGFTIALKNWQAMDGSEYCYVAFS